MAQTSNNVTHSDKYHVCECYGHTQQLPNYKKLTNPRTLQGFYAKQKVSACPCIPNKREKNFNTTYCSENPAKRNVAFPEETYRDFEPGKHRVHKAASVPGDGATLRDPVTRARLVFPNACNYGGTVAKHTFPAIGQPRRLTPGERKYEQMYDRKEFLKAVLRDEICHRAEAEKQLEELENETGLRGSRHARLLAEAAAAAREAQLSEDHEEPKTVGEQYDAVMDELRFVTRQPVGSKLNIIRMYYTLEEQERMRNFARSFGSQKTSGRV
ncbi:uncharacterized protein TEOVI_000201300 [Trypanosoma equiperdum]|uniref:Uncharacterized protein n=4 Tax=Trypanozoon TaxID=39700 RepID=Q583F5_TRYB2|nr:hypothetical protein, conserved [Trypanosoma brucei gambiense DAL972]XP_844619.1 hypothetical protein, conserved [Trypanosoma brucei brucei TREU927]AAX80500.1 hypothetical protein, conserved [Trypanosoma brucei]RHW73182.1 hypothetical protein DPX39_040077700 [Trypanosoma brucei equiperdum]SCU70440.1 hypothetical protein, conserved [Trypanosoma equiperdum]AAZ11060.1 hypothetical protein, conserved [Trypanosoma brucei brucei TREU927]CBH10789.1 hypothetical protein, conserved [Trypanosoma bru|eukprot:XP_011773077.1 hypothetical protein, conserved [Trypanosoma brucei gambiense DAL972]